jgi:hypothetical protein
MTMTLTDNEAYFTSHRAEIDRCASASDQFVVIVDGETSYYGSQAEAVESWTNHDGAVLKSLAPQHSVLVASNFLHHSA